jgi:2,5-diamino-6-(ribosylamino)-4(3H)-pyrimidinone 5'-phosphate reductase
MCSVDGRTLTKNWGNIKGREAYEQVHNTYDSDAWMCGRVTMERDFASRNPITLHHSGVEISKEDYVADHGNSSFAVALDNDGKLHWEAPEIDGDHIIAVLSEHVPSAYLAYLQEIGISYIFAGSERIDLKVALTKLRDIFNIKKLMLEGGGHLNSSMLDAGLVDELSILYLPVADGNFGSTALFEKGEHPVSNGVSRLKLLQIKQMDNDVIWVNYKVNRN